MPKSSLLKIKNFLRKKHPKKFPQLLLIGGGLFLIIFVLSFFKQTPLFKKEVGKPIIRETKKETLSEPSPMTVEITPIVTGSTLKVEVTPPATFGYSKLIDLPGIGVRALFPENSKVTYYDPTRIYTVSAGKYDVLNFTLDDYLGGGRREWFKTKYGYQENIFTPFTANNHSGYLVYPQPSGNKPIVGEFFYFTAVKSNKMLVLRASNGVPSPRYFFNGDLEQFKSFLSTMKILEPNLEGVERPDQRKQETQRWSNIRKTVWGNEKLGLRVTAPEWIESRLWKTLREDGTWEYGDWTRIYPEAKPQTDGVIITGLFFGGTSIGFLETKYTGKTFTEVVNSRLPGAGWCAQGWKQTKSECTDLYYCYTKEEVLKNLLLKKTAKFGPYTGQLWGLHAGFNQRFDCRGEDIWLIQAKDGQFVSSTIYPDSETIRLEGF